MTREQVGLPPRPFLYTLDQVASLISVDLTQLKTSYLYYEGRSSGRHRKDLMRTRNIAPLGDAPDWRVAEVELARWLRSRGYRVYERVQLYPER